ncbi:hypothetical protein Q3G72_001788 [Acer saccharum]|nr:hypothetical protein Q3G72_001788 [Acer saccharum]
MGGVGKTTLAKAVYNKLVGKFKCRGFIANVKEISRQTDSLISLQHKLIDDLSLDNTVLKRNEIEANISANISAIKEARKHKTAAVNGVLVGRVSPQKNDVVEITDSVPLFHTHLCLLPNLETPSSCKKARKALLEERPGTNNSTITAMISMKWKENLQDPGNCSRLWDRDEITTVLKLPKWKQCTEKTLPSDFSPSQLAVLDLSESGIERVWDSNTNKVAKNLMVLNLRGCWNLADVPDLSEHPILEKLVLERCTRLTKIHESVGDVSTLLHLNLSGLSRA